MTESDFKKSNFSPLYEQVVTILKQRIIAGEWQAGFQLPPEPELALTLQVSRPTLRKSLKLLIEQNLIIQRKGRGTFVSYQNTPKKRIAILTGNLKKELTDFYSMKIFSGLNINVNLNPNMDMIFLDGSDEKKIIEKFHASSCDGLICIPDSDKLSPAFLGSQFKNIPMVFFNCRDKLVSKNGFYSVCTTPSALDIAVENLMKLGHHRIAYLAASSKHSDLNLRNIEFLKLKAEYGRDGADFQFIDYSSKIKWYNQARTSAYRLCKSQKPPTAILCPNSTYAYGAWQGIMDAGLNIPKDISIVGFDCEKSFNPYLSSIIQPIDEMAKEAMRIMNQLMQGNKPKHHCYSFEVKFEERGSCAPPLDKN